MDPLQQGHPGLGLRTTAPVGLGSYDYAAMPRRKVSCRGYHDAWSERSLQTDLAAILSRRLNAPPALRAGPWIPDVQEVEADVRLYDPFNGRAF